MRHSILLPQTFLPLDSVKLGRLVLHLENPQSDYLDLGEVQPNDKIIKSYVQFDGQESNTTNEGFGALLAHLLAASHSKRRGTHIHLTTEKVTTYLMTNSGQWFMEAVRDDNKRRWIERAHEQGDDIYFVAGYHTMFRTRVYEGRGFGHSTTGQAALPVGETLTAAGVIVPFNSVIDPSVSMTQQQQQAGRQVFTAEGEQIIAVLYRKVQFKWYSRQKLHDTPLGPNQWKTFWTRRGETDEIAEVDLQDDLELADENTISNIEGDIFSSLEPDPDSLRK